MKKDMRMPRRKYKMQRRRKAANFFLRPESPKEEDTSNAVLENLKNIHEREVKNLRDNFLRARADMENFRKRTSREKLDLVKFANESLISYILPVLDNFSHAWKAAENVDDLDSFKDGINLIHQQLKKVLADSGLEEINPVNTQFDPHFHEAIATAFEEDAEDNEILDVIRFGYKLKDRVLRPATVRVNKIPEKKESSPRGALKLNPQIKPQPLNSEDDLDL
jgi:molecular chaperone GrpE